MVLPKNKLVSLNKEDIPPPILTSVLIFSKDFPFRGSINKYTGNKRQNQPEVAMNVTSFIVIMPEHRLP